MVNLNLKEIFLINLLGTLEIYITKYDVLTICCQHVKFIFNNLNDQKFKNLLTKLINNAKFLL